MLICTKKFWLDTLAVSIVFVISILLRIPWNGVLLSRDSVLYLDFAEMWYESGTIPETAHFFPFVMYIYTLLLRAGIPIADGGIILNIVVGSSLPVLLFFIAEKLAADRFVSLASALLAAFSPLLIELSTQLQRDNIFLFFCGMCMWLLINDFYNTNRLYPILYGLFFALAQLCRIEGGELLFIFIYGEVFKMFEHKIKLKKFLLRIAIMISVFAAVCFLLIWLMQCFKYMIIAIKDYLTIW